MSGVKHSEFHQALRTVFGSSGPSLAVDLVLEGLGGRTAQEALDDGVEPQHVWDAVCATTDLPAEQRFPHRQERRKPAGP